MALSDREKRLLAEMEAALASDDPRLQSTLAGSTLTKPRLSAGIAASLLLILAGITTLFTGLVIKMTLVGVAGFLIALVGVISLLRALATKVSAPKSRPKRSLGDTLNERWQKRQGF